MIEPKGKEVNTDVLPVPDPTVLTTQALLREIASLKEVIFTRLDGMDRAINLSNLHINQVPTDTDKQIEHLKELHDTKILGIVSEIRALGEVFTTRFIGMDRAAKLIQDTTDKLPIIIDDKVYSLKIVQDEKFSSIQTQFRERDVRSAQSSKDSKVAVDAALEAAKEAVGEQNKSSALAIAKSEASTTKQIDQMGQFIQSGNKAVDDKIDDIKDRLTRIEGNAEGSKTVRTENTSSNQWVIGIAIGVVGVVITIVQVVLHYAK